MKVTATVCDVCMENVEAKIGLFLPREEGAERSRVLDFCSVACLKSHVAGIEVPA